MRLLNFFNARIVSQDIKCKPPVWQKTHHHPARAKKQAGRFKELYEIGHVLDDVRRDDIIKRVLRERLMYQTGSENLVDRWPNAALIGGRAELVAIEYIALGFLDQRYGARGDLQPAAGG